MSRYFLIWVGSMVLSVPSAVAEKAQTDAADVEAHKDCLTGKVEAGIALLAELFATSHNANFIYNQARCYEENGRPVDAINSFREYLRVAHSVSPEERADVEKHIADCQQLEAEQAKKAPKSGAGVSSTLPASAPPAPALSAPGTPQSAQTANAPAALDLSTSMLPSEAAPAPSPVYKTWWFWTGAAIVAAAAATTIVLLTAKSDSNIPGTPLGNHGVFQ